MNKSAKIRGAFSSDLEQQINFISGLFSNPHLRKEYLTFVVDNLKIWTQCECVGIRVISNDDVMPYEAFVGFSYEFWEHENWLSLREHQCGCIRVATGTPDPLDAQIMTSCGSLWTNNLQEFGKTIPEESYSRYRGKCIESGFNSLAVIPIRSDNKIIGLIHIADSHTDKLPAEKIVLIESVSGAIGQIIARFIAEDKMQAKCDEVKQQVEEMKDYIGQLRDVCTTKNQLGMLDALKGKLEAIDI